MSDTAAAREETQRKLWLQEAQHKNPPMDMERWSRMDPLDIYWEIEAIRKKLGNTPLWAVSETGENE